VEEATQAFLRTVGLPALAVISAAGHLWRYGLPVAPRSELAPALFDRDRALAIAGDGFADGRLEGAWLSGLYAAGRLLATVDR
jgi:predicted NAD/FAD-dependent oxidoreductase